MSKNHFIVFPRKLNLKTLIQFKYTLNLFSSNEVVGIDFSDAKWATPFYLLMASSAINEFKANSGSTLKALGYEHLTYFAHVGFFYSFGLPYGNKPGEADGKGEYLPITVIDVEQVKQEARNRDLEVGQVMEEHAKKLAKVLSRFEVGDLYDFLTYSMREMLRNIVEHSDSKKIAFSAQYYKKKRRVEVAINDWGCGLKSSLEMNPEIDLEDDYSAIQAALMPGVSGKGYQVKKLRVRTEWTNSGFGLYMTSRLCREVGSFFLGSGVSAVSLTGGVVGRHEWGFNGTSVCLDFSVDRLAALQDALDLYRREATKYRQRVGGTALLEPSVASTALHKNFSTWSKKK